MALQKSISPRQLERLLTIDDRIRSKTRQTVPLLAGELGVTQRTVHHDLAFLRDRFEAPLEFDLKQGYFYRDRQWRLPTIPLTQGELFALTLGARALEAYAGSVYEQDLRSSIQELAKRLPEKIWVDLQALAQERINFRNGAELLNLDPSIYQDLWEAWKTSRRLWVRYYTAGRNEETERVIDPYFVDIYRGTNPCLIAFCHTRKEFRDFRLDRIREYRLLDECFERDPTFNLQEYRKNCFQYEQGGAYGTATAARLYPVVIDFVPKVAPFIRERRWHHSQVIDEHDDGSLTLRLEVGGLNDLKRWVLGYGKEALAKSPPELVKLLREETEVMARQNETGDFE